MGVPLLTEYTYDIADMLYESNHYAEIFTECINDIVSNKEQYIDTIKFTGWYYKNYAVNKSSGNEIYVEITDITNNEAYIDRESDDIVIHINKKYVNKITKLKSLLQHEFIHIVKKMSANNGLLSNKETLRDESDDILNNFEIYIEDKDMQHIFVNDIDNILYVLSPNEQLATINAACKYVSELSHNMVRNIQKIFYKLGSDDFYTATRIGQIKTISKQAQIFNILKYMSADNIHFIPVFREFIKVWDNFSYNFKLILCYCLDKHGFIKTPYIRKNIHELLDTENMYMVDREFNKCYKYVNNVYHKYVKDLANAIYAVIDKNKLFLTENYVYYLQAIFYNNY